MSSLKYIAQIIASFIYSPIYVGIMCAAILFPVGWILSLPTFWMVLVLVLFGGFIEGLISLLTSIGMLPFAWIVDNNKVSALICTILILGLSGFGVYRVWDVLLDYGILGIIVAIIISSMIIQYLFVSVGYLWVVREERRIYG